jgi:hypothetical protein
VCSYTTDALCVCLFVQSWKKKEIWIFFFFTKVTGLLYLYGIVEDREEEAVKELLGHVSLHIRLLMDALVFLW